MRPQPRPALPRGGPAPARTKRERERERAKRRAGERPRATVRRAKSGALLAVNQYDAVRTLGVNELNMYEPLLLYSGFAPFTGSLVEASAYFRGGQCDKDWLEDERERLHAAIARRNWHIFNVNAWPRAGGVAPPAPQPAFA